MTPDAVSLVAVPLFHKNAMGAAIKPVLHGGGTVVIMPRFEPRAFLENLSRYRCTHTTGVPAVFILMLQGAIGVPAAAALAIASRLMLTATEVGAAVPFLVTSRERPRVAT